ncbi:DUF3515 domain-containing protein [Solwaraspora sp. WMMD791]|uniref:DUF3515 domain-containing protein n=1 Tax=Solwaraspora sp. WMMD791 TaxID=3016086 RepID=UPI00249CBD92|nr:DUF3515 domain-containing protein [Solwaraspora sp. WMMD791]WFE27299.1 DUF3515 domain-containing protein [Solwaraspora sp. WMMD791]
MNDQLNPTAPETAADDPPVADQPATGGSAAGGPDRTTRQAAIWATVVALPLTVIVALAAFSQLNRAGSADGQPAGADPSPSASASVAPVPTTPVQMAAPALDDRAEVVCRALLSQLPGTLRDLRQRRVSDGAEQNAAYGEPPITVACGVPPAEFAPTDLVYALDGVCWHAAEQPDATVWTTVDREIPVRVSVPGAYDEPGQWVAAFADTLIETVPSDADAAPRGCRA